MLIAIRVDSSIQIGIGHVMRCLTLANELRKRHSEIYFICRDLDGNISESIKREGFEVLMLPKLNESIESEKLLTNWEEDASKTIKAIGTEKLDWCVVDHYGLDSKWHKMLRGRAKHIFVIDDMSNRFFDCDLLMDQTYGRRIEDYKSNTHEGCEFLLGTEYALLRDEFRKIRVNAKKHRNESIGIKNILVSIGGMDATNITSIVIDGIESVDWQIKPTVNLVLNENAPHLHEIKQKIQNSSYVINILVNVENMAQLMFDADLAIGAGGTTSWERCCLGLPSLVVTTAKNQKTIVANLEKIGAIKTIGVAEDISLSDVKNAINELISSHTDYLNMSEIAFNVCHGNGTTMCVDKLLSI